LYADAPGMGRLCVQLSGGQAAQPGDAVHLAVDAAQIYGFDAADRCLPRGDLA
jgi:hypothetical protein